MTVSKITTISDTPSGTAHMATVNIFGVNFDLMTAGPYPTFNPSVSFIVSCNSAEEVDTLWNALTPGGNVMMEIGTYPFAQRYGWVTDTYGVSWQIMFGNPTIRAEQQRITPTLMLCGDICGKAEEAAHFYTDVFPESEIRYLSKYEDTDPAKSPEAVVKHTGLTLAGFQIALMDNGMNASTSYTLKQAVSFVISCSDQAEVDHYWERLTSDGGVESPCGWLYDKYGLPWQVVPTAMSTMMSTGTSEQMGRVTTAFMKMKKFDIATLNAAFLGEEGK